MRILAAILLFHLSIFSKAQTVSAYLDKIRNDAAALTAFFAQMPKGGDLHHHYSGSVYTETFINAVVAQDYFINKATLEVEANMPPGGEGQWQRFSTLAKEGTLYNYKELLAQKWSAKDYVEMGYPPHRQFFESFGHFFIGARATLAEGLLELKDRAIKEGVSYIETSVNLIPCEAQISDLHFLDESLRQFAQLRDTLNLYALLNRIYEAVTANGAGQCAENYNRQVIHKMHDSLRIDDDKFTMRYQSFVVRNMPPVELFKNIIVAFESANRSPLVVGVNIVAPEHYDIAMNDYWLHMQFFKYCHQKYPAVQYAMHAGELTLGLVKPEELTWHINSAVYDAKAGRIGHGVDIAYEKDSYKLLAHMAKNKIPVEINLGSNEFILRLKGNRHPIMLYKNAGVPIVISTDDAGILRTNLIEQFVLLAMRYPQIKYADIKQFVYNSITYSFIEESTLKQKLKQKLDEGFKEFERNVLLLAK